MTEKEKILGELFRDSVYTGHNVPEIGELFSKKIQSEFSSKELLLQQFAAQIYISAQKRKRARYYMELAKTIRDISFDEIDKNHPELFFDTFMRFKSFISEVYKRYERVANGLVPEIKDLIGIKIVLLHPTSQELLNMCYKIPLENIEKFSVLNTSKNFPLNITLSTPDKVVTKSDFSHEMHPSIILPNKEVIIPEIQTLGKDYIANPKVDGYQSYHWTYLISEEDNPNDDIHVEMHIETKDMHKWSTYGPACHFTYKKIRKEKFADIFSFDPKKVSIPGYDTETEEDTSGFEEPYFLKNLSKTF